MDIDKQSPELHFLNSIVDKPKLRIIDVDEIKSVPGNAVSHPFIKRVIGTSRRGDLDRTLLWNERDLLNEINAFK